MQRKLQLKIYPQSPKAKKFKEHEIVPTQKIRNKTYISLVISLPFFSLWEQKQAKSVFLHLSPFSSKMAVGGMWESRSSRYQYTTSIYYHSMYIKVLLCFRNLSSLALLSIVSCLPSIAKLKL